MGESFLARVVGRIPVLRTAGRDSREGGCEKGFSHQMVKGFSHQMVKGFSHQMVSKHVDTLERAFDDYARS